MANRTITISLSDPKYCDESVVKAIFKQYPISRIKSNPKDQKMFVEFENPHDIEVMADKYQDCKIGELGGSEMGLVDNGFIWQKNTIVESDITESIHIKNQCLISIKKCNNLKQQTNDSICKIFNQFDIRKVIIDQQNSEVLLEFEQEGDLELLDMQFENYHVKQLGENAKIDAQNQVDPVKFIELYKKVSKQNGDKVFEKEERNSYVVEKKVEQHNQNEKTQTEENHQEKIQVEQKQDKKDKVLQKSQIVQEKIKNEIINVTEDQKIQKQNPKPQIEDWKQMQIERIRNQLKKEQEREQEREQEQERENQKIFNEEIKETEKQETEWEKQEMSSLIEKKQISKITQIQEKQSQLSYPEITQEKQNIQVKEKQTIKEKTNERIEQGQSIRVSNSLLLIFIVGWLYLILIK